MDHIINAGRRDELDQCVTRFVAIAEGEARVHNCIEAPTQIGAFFFVAGLRCILRQAPDGTIAR